MTRSSRTVSLSIHAALRRFTDAVGRHNFVKEQDWGWWRINIGSAWCNIRSRTSSRSASLVIYMGARSPILSVPIGSSLGWSYSCQELRELGRLSGRSAGVIEPVHLDLGLYARPRLGLQPKRSNVYISHVHMGHGFVQHNHRRDEPHETAHSDVYSCPVWFVDLKIRLELHYG